MAASTQSSLDNTELHWKQVSGSVLSTVPILPPFLSIEGDSYLTKCYLPGQATKGPNAAKAENRLITFDIEFCYARLKSLLSYLSHDDQEALLNGYLRHEKLKKQLDRDLLTQSLGVDNATKKGDKKKDEKKS